MGSVESVPELIQVIKKDNNVDVRRNAVAALGRIADKDDKQVVQLLCLTLKDSDLTISQRAAEALIEICSSQVIKEIITLLGEDNVNIKRLATRVVSEVIGKTGKLPDVQLRQLTKNLTSLTTDSDVIVRQLATKALSQIDKLDEKALNALIFAVEYLDLYSTKSLAKNSNLETLKRFIKFPQVNIYDSQIFPLARTLAVRYGGEKVDFIPVYPEKVRYSPLITFIKRFQRNLTIFLRQLRRKIKQAIASRKE